MADLRFSAQISEQALSSDTTETLIQLAAVGEYFLMVHNQEMSQFK
jgi:hypothetical protein